MGASWFGGLRLLGGPEADLLAEEDEGAAAGQFLLDLEDRLDLAVLP